MNTRKIVVNISDAKASNCSTDILATYSLGSCIAVCLYDDIARAGGLLHYQLPDSSLHPERAVNKPFMFADTGLKKLYDRMVLLGATKRNIHVTIAGGASIDIAPKGFDIGKRNHLAIRKLMWRLGLRIGNEDVGGDRPRNVYLDIATGNVSIKTCRAG